MKRLEEQTVEERATAIWNLVRPAGSYFWSELPAEIQTAMIAAYRSGFNHGQEADR